MADSVLIVGGGVVGLSTGFELLRSGVPVTIFEKDRAGRGTSWLAAGMLAPDTEIGFEERELYNLNRESLRRWPDFAAAVEASSGQSVDYRDDGTLIVADDPDSTKRIRRLYEFQQEQGLDVDWLTGDEARDREPFVGPRVSAAIWVESDHQVDNRLLLEALRDAFLAEGGDLREHTPVDRICPDAESPAVVTEEGETVSGREVVVAAGVWSRQLDGLEPGGPPPVRPVKGQMVQLQMKLPFALEHVIRGPDAYLAPKSSGRLVIGATSEEMGFDTDVTAGGLYDLLEGAWEVVPGVYDLSVDETWAGLRPASRDHAPILGRSGAPGVIHATGHYRHGILLAPVTAQEVARLIETGETSRWIEPFSPARFSESIPQASA
ncbi:glycine oxidase ThiO [Longibacter salinarum]|uniref:Glycine oxidase ThiO n=1 Tax=Longibacter salinarum TaxID=1850348 RepID=A0A2A8D1U5_9BACT|nr:glycine oxidase ThiO [Longibacter salinarum]PEN14793.1 glycine oxidase ThiO [Longibacter salinarum]